MSSTIVCAEIVLPSRLRSQIPEGKRMTENISKVSAFYYSIFGLSSHHQLDLLIVHLIRASLEKGSIPLPHNKQKFKRPLSLLGQTPVRLHSFLPLQDRGLKFCPLRGSNK